MSASTPLEALVTVLAVHDGALELERDEGFPGMFERDGQGELAALEALGYTVAAIPPADASSGPAGLREAVGDAEISANVERFVRQQAGLGLALSSPPQTQMQAFADIDLVIGQLRDSGYSDWPDILTRAVRTLAATDPAGAPE